MAKSKLFATFDLTEEKNKRFTTDLAELLNLTDKQRDVFVRALPELVSAKTETETSRVVDDLTARTKLSRVSISHVAALADFFVRNILDEEKIKEDPSLWTEDLIALGLVRPHQQSTFLKFLRMLIKIAPELMRIRKGKTYGTGVLPSLMGSGTTVELRGVFDRPFRWGEPVVKYSPELRDIIPIISIHISFDSGEPDEIAFQATPEELQYLIDEFQAALKSAQQLQKRVRLVKSSDDSSGRRD